MTVETALFALLRAPVCGSGLTAQEQAALTPELLAQVLPLAQKHDLAHLAGYALKQQKLLGSDEISRQFDRQTMQAMYRYVQLSGEYTLILQTLQQNRIPHLPLKGSVLRDHYPQGWMRTSGDIDILVQKEDLDRAVEALIRELEYTRGIRGDHDITLLGPMDIHLELHYDTIGENSEVGNCREVLSRVWQDAVPIAPGSCQYAMSDAMFYFYHIAHMAKHFENGGCGIRPFLDLWILNHRTEHDAQARNALLKEGGLEAFGAAVETLTEVWFSGAQYDSLCRMMRDYLLNAGAFGNIENFTAVGRSKAGGTKRYLLRRIFMPYGELKDYFPVLVKHPWLTPFCQIARWFRILFRGGLKRAKAEYKTSVSAADADRTTASLLRQLGLS